MVQHTPPCDTVARLLAEAPPLDEAQASIIVAALAGNLPAVHRDAA